MNQIIITGCQYLQEQARQLRRHLLQLRNKESSYQVEMQKLTAADIEIAFTIEWILVEKSPQELSDGLLMLSFQCLLDSVFPVLIAIRERYALPVFIEYHPSWRNL